jgi:hypothetical protein
VITPEQKAQVIAEMRNYLTKNLGYPNCNPKVILQHLLPMWQELEKKGLVKGITYEHFAKTGHQKYMEYEMRRIMGI